MDKLFIQGIIVLLLWVGAWGITEMAVDAISGESKKIRLVSYVVLILISILLIWAVEVAM